MAFPGTYNFNYYRGDTYEFVIRPKNPNGAEFQLDSYTARFVIASARGASPSFAVEAQAVINSTNDTVTCTILPGVGAQLSGGTTYVYDVQITSGPSVVYTLLTGSITVTNDVTGA